MADEPLGAPAAYGDDRVFAYLRNADEPDADLDAKIEALGRAGHPTITPRCTAPPTWGGCSSSPSSPLRSRGWVLGINPFDQPNVQEAKDNTAEVLAAAPLPWRLTIRATSRSCWSGRKPPHYVAIMGYLRPSEEFDAAVTELRTAIRDATRATTTFGYGLASSTRPGSCTRAGRRPACSSSSSTTATRTWRFPRGLHLRAPEARRRRATSGPCATTACRPCKCASRVTQRRR